MKTFLITLIAFGLILAAGAALAAGTTTVNVSATVVGTCKFLSGGTITYTLDPSVGGTVAGNVTQQPQFWCTKGATYTITDDKGLNASGSSLRMKHATLSEYIVYSFTYTSTGTGTGKSSPVTMNLASQVVESAYIDASAGAYTDTVTLTITP